MSLANDNSHPDNRVTTRQAVIPQLAATNRPKVKLDTELLCEEYQISYMESMSWMMRSSGV